MAFPRSTSDDTGRRRELRRMRGLATGLLVLMLVVFIAARFHEPLWPWLSFVEAFAEAAMVGALADWFAVTALFRHPLRVPIPHTAIIPRNKERLGRSLGNFIANNFLDEDVVVHKLRSLNVAPRAADWLSDEDNSRFLAERLTASMPALLDAMDDQHVRAFAGETVVRSLRAVDVAPAGARVLSVLIAHRHHQALFDRLLVTAGEFLEANSDAIRAKVADKTAWWVPKWLDERLFQRIMAGVEETLLELRAEDHPWRARFNEAVEGYVARLGEDPEYQARAAALRDEILDNPQVREYVASVLSEMAARLRRDLTAADSATRDTIHQALRTLGRRLRHDPEMLATVNLWVEHTVQRHVVPRRGTLGAFISGVVARWDTPTLVDKLEVQVGKDLQYIRINGTLVGGLVGLAIHALTTALT